MSSPIGRRLWYVGFILLDGGWTFCLGTLAFEFPWLPWSATPIRWLPQQVSHALTKPVPAIAIASASAGLVLAPVLLRFLERNQHRPHFRWLSFGSGIVFQFFTAYLAMIIAVPLFSVTEGLGGHRFFDVIGMVAGVILAVVGGPYYCLMFLPFIIIGGGFMGG